MVLVSCLLVLLLVPLPELGSSDNLEGFLPWLPHDARPREDDSSLQQLEARLAKDDSSLQQLEARLAKAQEVQRQAQEAQRQAELREAQAQAQLRLAEARVPLFSDRATRILGGVLLAVLVLVAAWASAWSKYNSSGDKATPGVSSLVEALIAPDLEVHEGGPAERFSGDQRHQIAVLQREQARLRQTVAESKEQVLQANRRAEEAKSPPRGGRKESTEAQVDRESLKDAKGTLEAQLHLEQSHKDAVATSLATAQEDSSLRIKELEERAARESEAHRAALAEVKASLSEELRQGSAFSAGMEEELRSMRERCEILLRQKADLQQQVGEKQELQTSFEAQLQEQRAEQERLKLELEQLGRGRQQLEEERDRTLEERRDRDSQIKLLKDQVVDVEAHRGQQCDGFDSKVKQLDDLLSAERDQREAAERALRETRQDLESSSMRQDKEWKEREQEHWRQRCAAVQLAAQQEQSRLEKALAELSERCLQANRRAEDAVAAAARHRKEAAEAASKVEGAQAAENKSRQEQARLQQALAGSAEQLTKAQRQSEDSAGSAARFRKEAEQAMKLVANANKRADDAEAVAVQCRKQTAEAIKASVQMKQRLEDEVRAKDVTLGAFQEPGSTAAGDSPGSSVALSVALQELSRSSRTSSLAPPTAGAGGASNRSHSSSNRSLPLRTRQTAGTKQPEKAPNYAEKRRQTSPPAALKGPGVKRGSSPSGSTASGARARPPSRRGSGYPAAGYRQDNFLPSRKV